MKTRLPGRTPEPARRSGQALRERLKELTCLYRVAQICRESDRPIEVLLRRVADAIPSAWQHAASTRSDITLDGRSYRSAGPFPAGPSQTAPLVVRGRKRGTLRIVSGRRARGAAPPFLREEQALLDEIARHVSLVIEYREAQAARQALEAQLRHADRLATIGKLAAGVAHELNEPLGAILGFAQLLAKTTGLPARAAGDLNQIERAALHAREIIRGLLTFARQSAPRLEPVDLNALIEDGLDRWALRGEDGSITLDLERPLPRVAGDAAQLRQVLTNLVLNAIQAMPAGGTVRLGTRRAGNGVELAVTDTGQGIDPADMPRIFDPFFTTKDVDQGSGLGLSVVHGIVTAHGGTLRVESSPGKGTRVAVRLPLAASARSRGDPP